MLRQLDLQSWFLGVAVEDSRVQATASVLAQFQAAFTRLPDLQAWRDAPREGAYPILDSVLTVPAWADVWPLCEWPLLKPVPDYFAAWQRNFAAPGPAAAPAAGGSENIEVPTLLVGGWFDLFLAGTIASYQALVANAPDERAARAHRLLIGPWGHSLHAELSGEIGAGAGCGPGPARRAAALVRPLAPTAGPGLRCGAAGALLHHGCEHLAHLLQVAPRRYRVYALLPPRPRRPRGAPRQRPRHAQSPVSYVGPPPAVHATTRTGPSLPAVATRLGYRGAATINGR